MAVSWRVWPMLLMPLPKLLTVERAVVYRVAARTLGRNGSDGMGGRGLAAFARVMALAVIVVSGWAASTRGPKVEAIDGIPVTGTSVEALVHVEQAMIDYMVEHDIGAGALGIMKDGVVVYHRGFGWRDFARAEPVPPDVMMRIASVTKPLTASVVRRLVEQGAIRLDERVFDLGQPGGGLLRLEPFRALGDPRLADVTVEHLLGHAGGWDRASAGPGGMPLDLTYLETRIAAEMGVPSPPGRERTVRWILGQPLQFDPGRRSVYSNIGYLVLGLIVEDVTGRPLIDVLHEIIFEPLGVERTEVLMGRTRLADRSPREPLYAHRCLDRDVFDPDGPFVPKPEGGWHHEARAGQGAIVTSTVPLLRFLETYYVSGPDIGRRRTGREGPNWRRNHTGSLAGTDVLARQRADGVNFVVLFNQRGSEGSSHASRMRSIVDRLFDDGPPVDWPTRSNECDCNGNGRPDGADVSSGRSADRNRNGVPDECEAGSAAPDCNENGEPDVFDLRRPYVVYSPALSPIGGSEPREWIVRDVPRPLGDVLISAEALGDLGEADERIGLRIDDEAVGLLFERTGSDCASVVPDVDHLLIPAARFARFAADGELDVTVLGTPAVAPGPCGGCPTYVRLRISYDIAGPSVDADGDGVPDECQRRNRGRR